MCSGHSCRPPARPTRQGACRPTGAPRRSAAWRTGTDAMRRRDLATRIAPILSWLAMVGCGAETDLTSETSAPIIGGHSAPHADYGWFASLWNENGILADSRFCGGSLIAPAWVLTAAHCVPAGVDYVEIGPTDSTERQVLSILIHPDMDIALLHMSSSSSAEPVGLNVDRGFPAAVSIFT